MDKIDLSTAQYYLEQGERYAQSNDWQGAIAQYHRGITIQPNEPLLYCQLAEALLALNDPISAINHLETAQKLATNPQAQAYSYWLLGKAYEQNNWLALAFEAYSQAVVLDPPSFTPEAHILMGKVCQEKQDYASARTCYLRALAIDPLHPDAHSQIFRAYLAEADLGTAHRKLQEIANLDSALLAVKDVMELAIAYAKHQNFDLSLELTYQAIALDPQYASAHCHLGNMLQRQGRLKEALLAYQEALELNPSLAPAYFNTGITLAELQQIPEAIACFEAVLELDPQYREAAKWLNQLKPPTPATSPDTPPA